MKTASSTSTHSGSHAGTHANGQAGGHDRMIEPRKKASRSTLAAHAKFLAEFITHPGRMGAVAASSPALAKRMADQIDWSGVRSIVEFGSGTGVVTEELAKRTPAGAKFFTIERSPELAAVCRKRLPHVKLYEDSAENIVELCRKEGIAELDVVVSCLPWASFPEKLQDSILAATMKVLKPGGTFVMFGYQMGLFTPAGRRFHSRLPQYFDNVRRSRVVWLNLPPALVFMGERKQQPVGV
ncbi:MAG TPA: methyltransferase domain-containing protein [Phycisphaerales bacterium]